MFEFWCRFQSPQVKPTSQSLLNRLIIMASKFFGLNDKTNAVSRLSSILVSFPFLLLEAKRSQISKKLIDFNMEKE